LLRRLRRKLNDPNQSERRMQAVQEQLRRAQQLLTSVAGVSELERLADLRAKLEVCWKTANDRAGDGAPRARNAVVALAALTARMERLQRDLEAFEDAMRMLDAVGRESR
jgi:hypothetical protein